MERHREESSHDTVCAQRTFHGAALRLDGRAGRAEGGRRDLGQHRAEVASGVLGRKPFLALREFHQLPLSRPAAPRGIRGIMRRRVEYLHFGALTVRVCLFGARYCKRCGRLAQPVVDA